MKEAATRARARARSAPKMATARPREVSGGSRRMTISMMAQASSPPMASTRGYRGEIGAPQQRALPRSKSQPRTGRLSKIRIGVLHEGQWEGGLTTLNPAGTR
jgi:hypothetical protein